MQDIYRKSRRERRKNARHQRQVSRGSSPTGSLRSRSKHESASEEDEPPVYNQFTENCFDLNPSLQCLKCEVSFLAPQRMVALDNANNPIGPSFSAVICEMTVCSKCLSSFNQTNKETMYFKELHKSWEMTIPQHT